jgi:hypothetical protein
VSINSKQKFGVIFECDVFLNKTHYYVNYTAILYRASTGPEQGFPCEVFHTGKNLFSLQGPLFSLQGFPCEKTSQVKPCFHYREWVCSVATFGG